MVKKKCTGCGKEKTLRSFYFKRTIPKYESRCKLCYRKQVADYKRAHPEAVDRHRGTQRMMRVRGQECRLHPMCANIDRSRVLLRGKGICGICGKAVRKRWHMDHIIPISKGGLHCYYNLQPSHIKCNLRKGNRVGTT